jgi:hypothetical protein
MSATLSMMVCPACGHQASYNPVIDLVADPCLLEAIPDDWDDWRCEGCHAVIHCARDVVVWTDSGAVIVLADAGTGQDRMAPRTLFERCAELLTRTGLRRSASPLKAVLLPALPVLLTMLRTPCRILEKPVLPMMGGNWAGHSEILSSLADELFKAAHPELVYEVFDSVFRDFPDLLLDDALREAAELGALACGEKRSSVNPSSSPAGSRLRHLAILVRSHLDVLPLADELSLSVAIVFPQASAAAFSLGVEGAATPEPRNRQAALQGTRMGLAV